MELDEVVHEMRKRSGKTITQIMKSAGFESRSTVDNINTRKDVRVSTLIKIAHACGYEVVVTKKGIDPDNLELPMVLEIGERRIPKPRDNVVPGEVFDKVYQRYRAGEIKGPEAAKELGMVYTSFLTRAMRKSKKEAKGK